MSKKPTIPKSFKLFATTVNVEFDNNMMGEREVYGDNCQSTSKIRLCDSAQGIDLSEDVIVDTFYHEKAHSILRAMGEYELNTNEKFVDIFARLWRQADETAEY